MSVFRQIVLSLIVILSPPPAGTPTTRAGFSERGAGGGGGGSDREAVAAVAAAAGGGSGGRGGAVLVVTAAVGTDETGIDVRAIGTVAAAQEVTLYPQDSGIVTEVAFTPGTKVEKGQTLVRLDDSDQQVALEKAKIALDTAQAALDRAQQLAKSNNITTVALTDARTAQRNAEIGLKAAQNDLAKRTIKAPFAGIIGLTDIAVGDLISSSKAIATLDDMSKVTVSFDVPERASGLVAVGQPVTASTEALAGKVFKGTVSAVDNRVDPVARTLKVEATLPNNASVLKPGMALTVAMSFPGEPHPSVPSLAVQWDRSGAYVWKIADGSAHRTARADPRPAQRRRHRQRRPGGKRRGRRRGPAAPARRQQGDRRRRNRGAGGWRRHPRRRAAERRGDNPGSGGRRRRARRRHRCGARAASPDERLSEVDHGEAGSQSASDPRRRHRRPVRAPASAGRRSQPADRDRRPGGLAGHRGTRTARCRSAGHHRAHQLQRRHARHHRQGSHQRHRGRRGARAGRGVDLLLVERRPAAR